MCVDRIKDKENYFKGCLIGGAIGDALGYAVEFYSYDRITDKYGPQGIREFDLSRSEKALISDDTQMTLFTANGILAGETYSALTGVEIAPHEFVYKAYLDWLTTQGYPAHKTDKRISWLMGIPQLLTRRAPGNTCISSLLSGEKRSLSKPINTSKGCGAVMRIAPFGLFYGGKDDDGFLTEAMEIGALTHSHPLSHYVCALVSDIIGRIIYGKSNNENYDTLIGVIEDAVKNVCHKVRLPYGERFEKSVYKAINLSKNDRSDVENVTELGEGWVAEETVAIAIYCAIKYQNDPIEGIIAAVNHGGDSDSTGAVAGNILGAWNGYAAFPKEFVNNLEISNVIEEIAVDLVRGTDLFKDFKVSTADWLKKYDLCR